MRPKKPKNLNKIIDCFLNFNNKTLIENIQSGQKTSYIEFFNRSREFSNYLKINKKINQNDRIVIKLDNSEEYLIAIFACFIGGYVACPIDKEISSLKYKKLLKILRPAYKVLSKKDVKYFEIKKKIIKPKDKISLIIFTSGTTGEPKGVQIKTDAYLGSASAFGNICEYNLDSKIYHCLAMHFNAGLLNTFFAGIFYGSKILLGPKINSLNILFFWKNILEKNISSLHLVPEIANALCKLSVSNQEKEYIKKIDKIISTGGYLYESTKADFEMKYQKRLLSCYGLTEVGGPITLEKWEQSFEEYSVGEKIKEIKIKIIEKKKLNHIFIKTPYMFDSYLLQNNRKKRPKLLNGYYDTNDIGYITNNQLFISGRRKDIFKKGSEIISAEEIQNVCLKSSVINDCCVIIKDDQNKGSKIYIMIKIINKKDIIKSIKNLNKFLIKNLKRIELPEKIIPVPEILKTNNGKIRKLEMEKVYL